MDIEDVVIEDLYGFFMSFSINRVNNMLKSINSIIPYLAFVIASNDRAYSYMVTKLYDWDSKRFSDEYEKCPWIKCKFVTRMTDLEKEKKIIYCLLYLCSDDINDDEIYEVLSAGWKRISLFVENNDVIDINDAPLRKKIEEKWVLCILSYIKNRMIIQAKNKKEWYNFSSELFFYYEYIIQLMDIDLLQNETLTKISLSGDNEIFIDLDDDFNISEEDVYKMQSILLLREKEKFLRNVLCELRINRSSVSVDEIKLIQYTESRVKSDCDINLDQRSVAKQLEYYQESNYKLEKSIKELFDENERLKKLIDVLSEEISLLRIPDENDEIMLEDECDWEYLYKKKIVICGGRLEWIKKIKQLFPQWKYIENDNIRFDGHILKDDSIDVVVFNKRFVSHGLFYRVASQKPNNVPLLCINSSNVEFSLQTICNKLKNFEP